MLSVSKIGLLSWKFLYSGCAKLLLSSDLTDSFAGYVLIGGGVSIASCQLASSLIHLNTH